MPAPPLPLSDEAAAFWPTILAAKRRSSWTDSDLLIACSLCRDLALMERLSREIEVDGPTLENKDGRYYPHPACTILDATQRRVLATARQLQVHAVATQGKTDHQGTKNAAARELQGKLSAADRLIARPH